MSSVYITSSLSASPLPSICSCMSSESDMNATHSVTSLYLCSLCKNTMHQSTANLFHLAFTCIFQPLYLDAEQLCVHKSNCNLPLYLFLHLTPAHVIAKAQGLAILSVFKAGFMITAKGGSGIVIARLADGSNVFYLICFLTDLFLIDSFE